MKSNEMIKKKEIKILKTFFNKRNLNEFRKLCCES